MFTKAYFLVSMAREFCQCQEDYQAAVSELEAIPEVKSVEPIVGACDLMVQIEAPIRVIFIANKILPKEWVKRLIILRVEPLHFEATHRAMATETGDLVRQRA